jgi:hypothetical protein
MKTSKSLLASICFLFFTFFTFSQIAPVIDSIARTSKFSPEGFFDSIFDGRGNKLSLNDIRVDKTENDGVTLKSSPLCVQGLSYFNLYFESGSGMELNNALHNARRNVVCKVFEDISNFINSPLTTTGQKVNFWFRDQNMISPNDLVYASSFYSLPTGFQNDGIILDNETWKTINSGVDSYSSYLQPFGYYPPLSTNGNNGLFYHGYMVLNFNGIGSNTWNYNLSNVNISNTEFDLYTIVFNKVLHALGINSLIYFDGSSIVVGLNYFTRYDTFLMDNSETNHLISNNQGCSMTEYSFNTMVPLTALSNGCTTSSFSDYTDCQNAIKYVGTSTIPVYTPTCWEFDLSLSHFEDLCLPNQGSQINDTYYAKSNFFHPGANYVKRYMKPEERTVLCDLGYSVNNTYGSVANNNFYSYNTNCTSSSIVGLTDGITNNIYTNQATINNVYALNGSSFLSNDVNNTTSALNFECLQDLSYPTTLFSTTNGNSATNVNITFYEEGIHLLRYVPTNSSGTKGNVTYIYFYVSSNGCTSCNYVKNGEFNNGIYGQIVNNLTLITLPLGQVDCWQYMSYSPDVISNFYNTTYYPIIPGFLDQWDNSNQPSFLGLAHENFSTYFFSPYLTDSIFSFSESVQSRLNTTIQPNTNYTLSFRARLNSTNSNTSLSNHALTFTFSSDPVIFPYYLPINANSSLPAILPSNLESFFSPITISTNNNWNFYTLSFNSSSTTGLKFIEIINNSTIKSYIQVDNVELNKTADLPTLNLPSTLCYNQQIDLLDYLSDQNLNGLFYLDNSSLPLSSSIFDPSLYPAGMHQIIYTYVLNGCTYTVQDNVYINNATINVTIQATATTICNGASIQLTANGAQNYTWQPGNLNGNIQTITPNVSGNYTFTGTSNGCTSTATIPIVVANCNACTSNCTNYLGVSGIISQNDVLPNTEYCINNDVTINNAVTFDHNLVKIAPNVKITVPNNSLLTIKGSHFLACNDMWQGIVVNERGRVAILNSNSSNVATYTTLIEDAKIAIEFKPINLSQATPVLAIENATFNRNDIGIKINSYPFSNVSSVFAIKNTVFTCRDLNLTGYPSSWITTYSLKAPNPLVTNFLNPPYIHPNYSNNISLKPPFNNQRSSCGIYLENIGTNSNNSYNCFKIGLENNPSEFNLFDNMKVGIEGVNANIEVVNSVFQHHFKSEKSIFVTNTITNSNKSLIVGGSLQKKCSFYNANYAIHTVKYQFTQISYNTFRSDKSVQYSLNIPNPLSNPLSTSLNDFNIKGKNGIYMTISDMYQTKIEQNSFYNIESCIYGNFLISTINQATVPGITISQNIFDLDLTNNYLGIDRYTKFAVNFEGILKPTPPIFIFNNIMKEVFNGINLKNLEVAAKIYNNTIKLRAHINYTNSRSGIVIENLTPLNTRIIRSNIISGSGSSTLLKSFGIRVINSKKSLIECNSIDNTDYGLYFNNSCSTVLGGVNPSTGNDTKISKNDLSNHKFGLTLDYYGNIGPQGSNTIPSDNRWLGSNWSPSSSNTAGNYKTFCTNLSVSQNSPLYVRNNSSVYNPDDSYALVTNYSTVFSTNSTPQTLFPLSYSSSYTGCPNFPVSVVNPTSSNLGLDTTYSQLWQYLENRIITLDSTTYFSNDDIIKIHESYQLLNDNQNLLDSSSILYAFYTNYANAAPGIIEDISQLYEASNFYQMSLQLANVNPADLIEASYQRYYEIVLAFENESATPIDSLDLQFLANACPDIEGPAVYLAQSLYNDRHVSNVLFEGNCAVNENKHLLLPSIPNTKKRLTARVYPNPNAGHMNILLSDQRIATIFAEVYSVDGKLVHQGNYILDNGNFVLDLNLNNGSYHLVLKQLTTNETVHQQLIIQE